MSVMNQSAERSYGLDNTWLHDNETVETYLDFSELCRAKASGITYCAAVGLDIKVEAAAASFHRTGILIGNVDGSHNPQVWLQLDGDALPRLFVLTSRVIHPLRVRRFYTSYNGIKSYVRDVVIVGYGIAGIGLI